MPVPGEADPFLGRQDQVERLRAVAGGVSTGHPALVVMRGEAGIGKTRLVTEFCAELAAQGWAIRVGGCTPLIGPTLAYGPWTAAFGAADTDGGSAWWAREPATAEGQPPMLERLGERVLDDLVRAQSRAPVAVVLEDLHWADRSSMALLAFVVRGLRAARRVLVWVTARDEVAPGADENFELVLAELLRRDVAVALPVGRLAAVEVRQLTVAIAGPAADADWVTSVVRRSAGNPYAVRQLAAAGPAQRLPAALHAVLTGRLREAGGEVRAVVEAVSVAGVPVPPQVLEWALDAPQGGVDDTVHAGLRAGLLAVSADDRYEITHTLLAETAVQNLLPGRRQRLHARLAAAFTRHGSDGDHAVWLSLIAQHWSAAADPEQAIAALVEAGRATATAGAHPEAYRLFNRALELALRAADIDRETSIPYLRRACAAEAFWAGLPSESVELLQVVLKEATLTSVEEADLRLELARALRAAGRGRDAVAALAEAYEAVGELSPSLAVARTYAAHAAATMMTGRYRQVGPVVEAALAMLDQVTDGPVVAVRSNLLNTLGVSLALLGDLGRGTDLLQESITLARAADSTEDLCRGLTNLAFVLVNAGLFEESVTAAMRCIAEARVRGVEISAAGLALCNALESLVWLGRWAEAEELVRATVDRPFPDEVLASVRHSAAQLALGRGDPAAARGHLAAAEQAALGVEAPQLHAQLGQLRAEIALVDHEPHTALHVVDETLAAIAASDDDAHLLELVTVGLQALNDLRRRPAGLQSLGAAEIAGQAADLWEQTGQSLDAASAAEPERSRLRPAEADLCRLEYARLRDQDTGELWGKNAATWSRLQRRWMAAYAGLRQAEAILRLDRSDRKAAGTALAAAEESLAGLGEPVLLAEEIGALRRRARIDRPALAKPVTGPTAVAAQVGLTAREHEVLVLLADGLTNRRIATALHMTEKTASVHVSHIMAKLHVGNRGEAAAQARRLGLLPPFTP
jgi:DNA-binding CsgD family transcriptional regulator/tetratricopeptide (TPR) repeat protein